MAVKFGGATGNNGNITNLLLMIHVRVLQIIGMKT